MAGIDLLGAVRTPVSGENDDDLLYASAEDKTAGLASRGGNKYAKVERIDENDGGEFNSQLKKNVQGLSGKGGSHAIAIEMTGSSETSNSGTRTGYSDIIAAFNDENDPSQYMGIYEQVKHEISGIKKNVKRIENLASDYESADKTSEYKVIMDKLNVIITNNRKLTVKIKNLIQSSKHENDRLLSLKENQGSSMIQWRVNQLNSCVKEFKSTNMMFESTLSRFQSTMKETQKRLIGIVNTDDSLYRPVSTRADGQPIQPRKLNDDEIDELLEDPQAATQFLNKALKLQDVSDVLLDRLSELEIRHEGMLRIEQEIKELHELWQELSVIITEQQELLDNIENNVVQTRDYVQSGSKHLEKAEKHQKMSRKLQCCLLCFCVVVILAVVGYLGGFGG